MIVYIHILRRYSRIILVPQRNYKPEYDFYAAARVARILWKKNRKEKKNPYAYYYYCWYTHTHTHTWIVCIGRSLAGPCSSHNIITAAAAAHPSPLLTMVGRGRTAAVVSHARSCTV